MAGKELTYVFDEPEREDPSIVGCITVPREFGSGCLPITAAAFAEIERRALKAETEREVAALRVKLLERLMLTMVAAISRDFPGT